MAKRCRFGDTCDGTPLDRFAPVSDKDRKGANGNKKNASP
jgi:hypothetical protein